MISPRLVAFMGLWLTLVPNWSAAQTASNGWCSFTSLLPETAEPHPAPSLCQLVDYCPVPDPECSSSCAPAGAAAEDRGLFWEVFDPAIWVQPWVMRTSLREPRPAPWWTEVARDCAAHESLSSNTFCCLDGCGQYLVEETCDVFGRVCGDFKNFYFSENLAGLGLALAVAAPLANTHADEGIQHWYQTRLRTRTGDEWAKVGYRFGQHWLILPVFGIAMVGGKCFDHTVPGAWTEEWGERSLRAMLVGCWSVAALQVGLGGNRPGEGSSHWRPFQDNNGVGGHAFVGAIPFLTAAAMTENKLLKIPLFLGSFWSTWSRVHSDAHFFSQSALGWSMAFLAVQSVTRTDWDDSRLSLVPLDQPGTSGIGIQFRY